MQTGTRARLALGLAVVLVSSAAPWHARANPRHEEGTPIGLEYKVNRPDESYFDVAGRMTLLKRTDDPLLIRLSDKLAMGSSCRQMKIWPVLNGEVTLPSFHENPAEWHLFIEPFDTFEQTVSDLAGAWVASGDRYYADCLIDILEEWARSDALSEFQFSPERPQAWYAIESMIFAAALAYSTVTGEIDIAPRRRNVVEQWLAKVARRHVTMQSSMRGCCDDHFYRRSLYMTIVGVVTNDDELFRTGLRAVHVALDDLDEQGAFKVAIRRGWRALHYQNYILLHLVTILQIAYRQGYDLFELTAGGPGLDHAVAYLMRALEHPHAVEGLPPGEQDLTFTNDGENFAWMEIWLRHFEHPTITRFVRHYRPIFNRETGGYMTLYLKNPESPRTVMEYELRDRDAANLSNTGFDERYPLFERWKRSQ